MDDSSRFRWRSSYIRKTGQVIKMLKEYMKFSRKQPLNGLVIGLSLLYGANTVRKAFTKDADNFWGIGASTSTTSSSSSSHSMMDRAPAGDMMQHPVALYGIGASPAQKRQSTYGEDTYTSPLTLMGVPSHLKRRVGNTENSESYQPTNVVTPEVETVETVLGWI